MDGPGDLPHSAVVYGIASDHGGRLTIGADEAGATCVAIELPLSGTADA